MAKRFTMYSPTGAAAPTTEAAYQGVWFDRGWRKSPPKQTSPSSGEDTTKAADPADSEEE